MGSVSRLFKKSVAKNISGEVERSGCRISRDDKRLRFQWPAAVRRGWILVVCGVGRCCIEAYRSTGFGTDFKAMGVVGVFEIEITIQDHTVC